MLHLPRAGRVTQCERRVESAGIPSARWEGGAGQWVGVVLHQPLLDRATLERMAVGDDHLQHTQAALWSDGTRSACRAHEGRTGLIIRWRVIGQRR